MTNALQVLLATSAMIVVTSAALWGDEVTDPSDAVSPRLLAPVPFTAPNPPLCGADPGVPRLLGQLVAASARTETKPFQHVAAQPALEQPPVLYKDLGGLHQRIATRSREAQAWFDQGLLFTYAFNHAEARRAFRQAQASDPACAMCFWGEALVLGPNINSPMREPAHAPALAALARAQELAANASPFERALIEALGRRYTQAFTADRAALDLAYAAGMESVAARFPRNDTVQVLYAEALMDTQPWDYWEAGGVKPKGKGAAIVSTLETVLARNPAHVGAIHYYIHAVEASARPERALPHARRLAAIAPAAGHLVHMPAHIYYRLGLYRESLEANRKAMAIDERYFRTSPSDPLYKSAYYPHNIHFVMVSAQMGGDGATALDAARKLDAAVPDEAAKLFAALEPIKAAPYTTQVVFGDAAALLALPEPAEGLVLVRAMYHYARAVGHAIARDASGARTELAALERIERAQDFKRYADEGVPAADIVRTARLVASARLADATGDLAAAATAYEEAIRIEDSLAYMEPPYWYYPIRQSLGGVRLRQGRLDEAHRAFRDSLLKVRNNGWALAGLAETEARRGDARAAREARHALRRAWFGPAAGPDLARL